MDDAVRVHVVESLHDVSDDLAHGEEVLSRDVVVDDGLQFRLVIPRTITWYKEIYIKGKHGGLVKLRPGGAAGCEAVGRASYPASQSIV